MHNHQEAYSCTVSFSFSLSFFYFYFLFCYLLGIYSTEYHSGSEWDRSYFLELNFQSLCIPTYQLCSGQIFCISVAVMIKDVIAFRN